MTDLWNSWEVKPPPVCTVKSVLNFKVINGLKEILFDILKTLRNVDYLHKEAAILSRFLYKTKRIFRHDKGLQDLVKVNQCLKRYLKLNLCGIVDTFKNSLPSELQQGMTHAYLPTRQMLKWVLLRLQAFSRIFARLIEISKGTGTFFYGKINLGWSLNQSLLTFSAVARILVSSKFLTGKSIEWYSSLYKCLPYLEQSAEFLPEYKLPVDLKKWLGDVDLRPLKKKTCIDKVFELVNLVKDDEEDKDNEEEVEVKVMKESLFRSLFKKENITVDSDVEEVEIEAEEKDRRGVKRSLVTSVMEDIGVPVDDKGEILGIPPKKSKKKRKNFAKHHG